MLAVHSGVFPHYCDICKKGFQASNRYTEHMMKHDGRSFHCDYCGKGYSTKERLRHHQSIHTGIYRLYCKMCNRGFNVKSDLNKHEQSCVG